MHETFMIYVVRCVCARRRRDRDCSPEPGRTLDAGAATHCGARRVVAFDHNVRCEQGRSAGRKLTGQALRELFTSLAHSLPAFDTTRGPAVLNVQMCQNGMFGFIEVRDERLASTFMKFHGASRRGRRRVRSPAVHSRPPARRQDRNDRAPRPMARPGS